MRSNLMVLVVLGAAIAGAFLPFRADTVGAAEQAPGTGDAALAVRLSTFSQRIVSAQNVDPASLKASAALLDAAIRLDGDEPLYPRLLLQRLGQISDLRRDDPSVLDAIQRYRKLRPDDRSAQVQLIMIYLSAIETADKQTEYLRDILSRDEVPADVRSVVAVRLADLLMERSPLEAAAVVGQALRLNPLNFDALQRQYRSLPANATPLRRFEVLLAMLRSNPASLELLDAAATGLAEAGLTEESLRWYTQATRVIEKMGISMPRDLAYRYAIVAFEADQHDIARSTSEMILRAMPDDYGAAVLRLLEEGRQSDSTTAVRLRVQAHNALLNQFQQVRKAIGVTDVTTQPSLGPEIPMPDISGDPALLNKTDRADVQTYYRQLLGELAWCELYYLNQPDRAAKNVDQLAAMSAGGDAVVARLAGWLYLKNNKPDEAQAKLSAVADRDPLAALGLIMLAKADDPAQKTRAAADAATLLTANRGPQLLAAVLQDALKDRVGKVAPRSDAATIKAQLALFPEKLLDLLSSPQLFYSIRGEPLKVSLEYGEPVVAKVTLQNNSDFDLTVGPNGLIRGEIWFDVNMPQLRTAIQQPMQVVATDTIGERLVLKPGESTSQVVRLDDGILGQALSRFPSPPISLNVNVRTNGAVVGGIVVSLPGGYSTAFARQMQRAGFKIDERSFIESFKGAREAAITGDPSARIRNIDLLCAFIDRFRSESQDGQSPPRVAAESFMETVRSAASDHDASVRAWARFQYAARGGDEKAMHGLIEQMLGDPQWQTRLLGLAHLTAQDATFRKEKSAPLAANDADPTVRKFAAAVMQLTSAATQPTTSPVAP